MIHLTTGFPATLAADLWRWLNATPLATLGDAGPQSAGDVAELLVTRERNASYHTWKQFTVRDGKDTPLGYVALEPALATGAWIIHMTLAKTIWGAGEKVAQTMEGMLPSMEDVNVVFTLIAEDNALARKISEARGAKLIGDVTYSRQGKVAKAILAVVWERPRKEAQ